jgi:predicted CXXCH cytochrome family protein
MRRLLIPPLVWLFPALLAPLLLIQSGCSPEARRRALAKVFDGVPDPAAPAPGNSGSGGDSVTNAATPAKVPATPASRHQPFSEGSCHACHDALRSNSLTTTAGATCRTCHDPTFSGESWIHGPVAAGGCGFCHDPHQSRLPHLLKTDTNDLCLQCHDSRQELVFSGGAHPADLASRHCLDCHRPHGGDSPAMLKGAASGT